ncbi:ecdysone oxidase-like [Anticarsia gemmatalis]|uniref:ecdysone oxidase-like n=1 Tax=Anticarsia gemmatalis TaxID=129554 RepID=UPI003F772E1D
MDAASAVASITYVQNALTVMNMALHITGYMWLPGACVEDKAEYDYIVIGGGTSGAIIARRLAENKKLRILLIEAGGDPPLESVLPGLSSYVHKSKFVYNFTSEDDGYTMQCHQGNNFSLSLGKMLGGTSSSNYMSYERGNEIDYKRWAKAAKDSSWQWSKVLKYLKKTENLEDDAIKNSRFRRFHGYKGPLIVTRENRSEINDYLNAFAEVGNRVVLDLTGNVTIGYTKPLHTVGASKRQSTAAAFLALPTREVKNLDIFKHTEVTKILFRNKTAIGVKAVTKDKKTITLKAKREVILCAGAINSPKILMLSGIGPKKHLESKNVTVLSDLPVGSNYHDHDGVIVIYRISKIETSCKPTRPRDLHTFRHPFLIGYVAINKSSTYPDYVTTSYVYPNDNEGKNILRSCAFTLGLDYEICENLQKETKGYKLLFSFIKTSQPESRGKLLLRSTNPKDQPIIMPGTLSNKSDIKKYREAVKHFMKVGKSKFFKEQEAKMIDPLRSKCGKYEYGSDEYWDCYSLCLIRPSGFVCGTCAMGSVVDAKLRVKGVKGLRVADASVIPTIPVSGTSAPTMMIGEKAVDLIREDMK